MPSAVQLTKNLVVLDLFWECKIYILEILLWGRQRRVYPIYFISWVLMIKNWLFRNIPASAPEIDDLPLFSYNSKHNIAFWYYSNTDGNNDILQMDAKLLKLSAHLIAPSLADVYNLSPSTPVIPNEWKLARITPIYKGKGDISRECNYRPISVLSHIAKLFERWVCMQLLDYLESNDMITPLQSAYLKKHSTVTCLHKVVDDFCEMIDDGDICGIYFLDIEQGFDTIHHGILLQKLEHYGIQGYALQWFKQYLTNRTQCVRFGNSLSDIKPISIGVHKDPSWDQLSFYSMWMIYPDT